MSPRAKKAPGTSGGCLLVWDEGARRQVGPGGGCPVRISARSSVKGSTMGRAAAAIGKGRASRATGEKAQQRGRRKRQGGREENPASGEGHNAHGNGRKYTNSVQTRVRFPRQRAQRRQQVNTHAHGRRVERPRGERGRGERERGEGKRERGREEHTCKKIGKGNLTAPFVSSLSLSLVRIKTLHGKERTAPRVKERARKREKQRNERGTRKRTQNLN